MTEHELYKTGDADAPDAIKDRNGEVALNCCRKCGRGESDLTQPCIPTGLGTQPVAWRWRTLLRWREADDDGEWQFLTVEPRASDFMNFHHHEFEPLYLGLSNESADS